MAWLPAITAGQAAAISVGTSLIGARQASANGKFNQDVFNRNATIKEQEVEAIEAKNSIIRNLRYSMAHATKAYNDAIRVYEAKLVEFGIPAEELGLELLETGTSNMPAGLVAA